MGHSFGACDGLLAQRKIPTVSAELALQHGCAVHPLSVAIPLLHVRDADRLEMLIKLGADYAICLGVRTDGEKRLVSIDARNIKLAEILRRFFPGYYVRAQPSLVTVQEKSRADWLNYRLRKLSINSAPLSFNSMQVFFTLVYQLNPKLGGIAGSVPWRSRGRKPVRHGARTLPFRERPQVP